MFPALHRFGPDTDAFVRRELEREKIWARIHLVPLLLAEGDRDAFRREHAATARERAIMDGVPGWEVRAAPLIPSDMSLTDPARAARQERLPQPQVPLQGVGSSPVRRVSLCGDAFGVALRIDKCGRLRAASSGLRESGLSFFCLHAYNRVCLRVRRNSNAV
jgi:hypothetical protein